MKTRRGAMNCACALALGLALAVPATAFAADPAAETPGDMSATAPSTSTITGTIHATTLKATVPTKVSFNIDPGAAQGTAADGSTQKRGQYTSPTNYTITNYSAVDVYGYVSGVTVDGATLVNATGNLKKTPGAVGTSNISAMVGLSNQDSDMALTDTTDWLMSTVSDSNKYYAFNKTTHGKLTASTNAPTTAGGTSTMYIYGAVKNGGWAENDSFSVKPVFKITATDPSTPTT